MDIHLADVTIHIDQNLKPEETEKLENALRNKDGVVSVHINPQKKHLIVVEYNPETMHSADLIDIVRHQGLQGELIGL
jgi:methyl coenzyme M reductase subunit D